MNSSKTLSHGKEAEKWVVGSVILDPQCAGVALSRLRPTDFVDLDFKEVFRAIESLRRDDKPIDVNLLLAALKGKITDPAALLAGLLDWTPTSANVAHYAEIVREASTKRQLFSLAKSIESSALNGRGSSEILLDIRSTLEDFERNAATEKGFEPMTSPELERDQTELTFAISQILVEGQNAIIGGPHKSMKTTMLIQMAVSLATGRPFLGKFSVLRPYRVCVMSGESGLATIREIAVRCAHFVGTELREIDNLSWCQKLPQLGNLDHLVALDRFLHDEQIEFLFLDPIYLMMPGDEASNLFKQGELLGQLDQVCKDNGTTPVLIHHTKKSGIEKRFAPLGLENLAWAGFAEFARQWIMLNRREEYEPGTGEHRLWLSVGGSAGHSELWGLGIFEGPNTAADGRSLGIEVTEPESVRNEREDRQEESKAKREAERLERNMKSVLSAILNCDGGRGTKNHIKDRAGISGTNFNAAWAELLKNKSIVESGTIKKANGQTYETYEISHSDDSD